MSDELSLSGIESVANKTFMYVNVFLSIVTRPLTLTTDVLLRKDMGVRYLGVKSIILGAVFIDLATHYSVMAVKDVSFIRNFDPDYLPPRNTNYIWVIGYGWLALYLAAIVQNMFANRTRERARLDWHSYFRGSSRLPPLIAPYARLILLLLVVPLLASMNLSGFALLMLASIALAFMSDAADARRAWNLRLDRIDHEIEAAHMEDAFDQKPVDVTRGLIIPLPKRFKGQSIREFISEPGRTMPTPLEPRPA